MATGGSSIGGLPLRSALKTEDDHQKTPPASGTLKAVQIAEPVPEPQPLDDDTLQLKQFRASSTRRLSGKFSPGQFGSHSRASTSDSLQGLAAGDEANKVEQRQRQASERFLAQVGEWLDREREKAAHRKLKHRKPKTQSPRSEEDKHATTDYERQRSESTGSNSSDVSFDKLQRILEDSMASLELSSLPSATGSIKAQRIKSQQRRASLARTASSDTEYADGDAIVPSCDAWLDNSKTLAYCSASTDNLSLNAAQEQDPWLIFKNEILRIAHTLRLKGWRRIPLGEGGQIQVQRLSGALTNAVYVVTPPSNTPDVEGKKKLDKLLLRIYGPQVEHLIDREVELSVLRRLARKKIGPRLLGTFQNGRFEQYFESVTLTPKQIREPEVSRQIAKRMRELHDGVELLPHEREGGPSAWCSFDKWTEAVAKRATYLDEQYEKTNPDALQSSDLRPAQAWKQDGYVCGAPWPLFKATVEKYQAFVRNYYTGPRQLSEQLTFAHNDTQYGNILRIKPNDEKSPLLQPANKHKQLVVIDFEYASANTRGYEFANHFTEWTYDYTDETCPWACNHRRYPTVEEQRRFLKAYVDHRPQFPHASSTPRLVPTDGNASAPAAVPNLLPSTSSSSIVDFMLDARAPQCDWSAAERAREEETDRHVSELQEEARLWRPSNATFWTCWGIVQAPGLDESDEMTDEDRDAAVEEFDYLKYSQDRSHLFWGDVVQMGLVKMEELPLTLQNRLKMIDR